MDTIYCPKCGKPNSRANLFCQECGARLPVQSNLQQQQIKTADSRIVWESQSEPKSASSNPPEPVPGEFNWPAAPTYSASNAVQGSDRLISSLGVRLDSWADLIDGAGDKTGAVQAAFWEEITERKLPDIFTISTHLTPGGMIGKRRRYLLVVNKTGATQAVHIGEFGRDLYVNWDVYVRPVLKWVNILIMLGISLVLSFFLLEIYYFPAIVFVIIIIAALLGRLLRNDTWSFFRQEVDLFVANDISAMMFAVHHSLLYALDSVGINSADLRPKEKFVGGQRERII